MPVLVTHPSLRAIHVGGDHEDFLNKFSVLAPAFHEKGIAKSDLKIELLERIHLDPGGMFFMKDPWVDFEVEGIPFAVQAGKAEYVVHFIEKAEGSKGTKIPGWTRFLNFYVSVAVPESVAKTLLLKVCDIAASSDAIHSQLDMEESLSELVAKGYIVRKQNKND